MAGKYLLKIWILMTLLSSSTSVFAGDPVVLVYIIDGLQKDAAEVAAANGAKNLAFLMKEGVVVREAYCTSPAPRMFLPDGSLPWGTSSSPNVAMHAGTHVFESRKMDDIFLSARRSGIKSVFAGGALNYQEFTTPDYCFAGPFSDSAVVEFGLKHFSGNGARLIRLHLQQIRDSWSGPADKVKPGSPYQRAILRADALLGEMINMFKKKGVWPDVYIIVAGDHGMGITGESEHPPSVLSSWSTYMNFYGPGIKKGKTIPYAESPDIAIMVNYFLKLTPLLGHTDPEVHISVTGPTGTFLGNIFEGKPEGIRHPGVILKYLQSKNMKPSDDYAEYRLFMLAHINETLAR